MCEVLGRYEKECLVLEQVCVSLERVFVGVERVFVGVEKVCMYLTKWADLKNYCLVLFSFQM